MPDARDIAAGGRGFISGFGAATRAGEAKFSRERQLILDEERRAQQEFQNRLSEQAGGRAAAAGERAVEGQRISQERLNLAQRQEQRGIDRDEGAKAYGLLRAIEKIDSDLGALTGSAEDLKRNRQEIAFKTAEKDQYEAQILDQMNKGDYWRTRFQFGPGREARKLITLPNGQYAIGVVNDEINRQRGTPEQMGLWTVSGREVSPQDPPNTISSASVLAAFGLKPEREPAEREPRLVATVDPDDPSKTIYRPLETGVPFLTERPKKDDTRDLVTLRRNYTNARDSILQARRPLSEFEQISGGPRFTVEPNSTNEGMIIDALEPFNETIVYEVQPGGAGGVDFLPVPTAIGNEMNKYRELLNFDTYETWDHYLSEWKKDSRLKKYKDHELFKIYLMRVHSGLLPRTNDQLKQLERNQESPIEEEETPEPVRGGIGIGAGIIPLRGALP